MVRSAMPEPPGGDQSLGELVSVAMKDISQLVHYEVELAKTELRGDLKRVGLAGALGVVAVFTLCLVLVLLCIALAYGLTALGIWNWLAFLIVAAGCLLLIVAAGGIAYLKVRKLSGMKKTRESVTEGLGMLRRDKDHDGKDVDLKDAAKAGLDASPDGQQAADALRSGAAGEIAANGTPADRARRRSVPQR